MPVKKKLPHPEELQWHSRSSKFKAFSSKLGNKIAKPLRGLGRFLVSPIQEELQAIRAMRAGLGEKKLEALDHARDAAVERVQEIQRKRDALRAQGLDFKDKARQRVEAELKRAVALMRKAETDYEKTLKRFKR